jgi:hypothetical protein
MSRLLRMLTKEQHLEILGKNSNNVQAAREYSEKLKTPVSRQLVRYWRIIHSEKSKAAADRGIKRNLQLIQPQPDDDIGGQLSIPDVARRILVIPDIHTPYEHADTLAFLEAVRDKLRPDLVVNLGDLQDGHGLSFHESDPNLDSAGIEFEKARAFTQKLEKLFPNMLECHSNHGSLIYRRAKAHGIPVQMIRSYREMLFPHGGGQGWSWRYAWRVDTPLGPVTFKHQSAGDPLLDAAHHGTSLVTGHEHGKYDVQYAASSDRLYFAMRSGCLIDKDSLAFAYGKHTRNKPIIGCSAIIEGVPRLIPMLLDNDGRWIGTLKGVDV